MPASGPVYQPTTVTYEQQSDWARVSYLSQTVNNGVNRSKCLQWLLLAVGLFCLAAGLIMLVEGAVDYSAIHEGKVDRDTTGPLAIAIIGAFLTVVGLLFIGFYIRVARRRKGCPCFPSKDQRLARELDNQAANGQILTLNPSTDLLVTAQYGPVSEIAYQPPAVSEEEETRKLMGSDNKECIDDNRPDQPSQPNIVPKLRKISTSSSCFPSKHLAPLATGEEVTPSLRSSFCSVYYNITPYESELSLDSTCST